VQTQEKFSSDSWYRRKSKEAFELLTFLDELWSRINGLDRGRKKLEPPPSRGIADLLEHLWHRHHATGGGGERAASRDDGVGVDHGDRDTAGAGAARDEAAHRLRRRLPRHDLSLSRRRGGPSSGCGRNGGHIAAGVGGGGRGGERRPGFRTRVRGSPFLFSPC
jgi:hypothetical protein